MKFVYTVMVICGIVGGLLGAAVRPLYLECLDAGHSTLYCIWTLG